MRFARYAWSVLAYNLAVVLWGAYVRATGSGAGCGNHWPLCNGGMTPHSPSLQTVIEFTHRASSGLDLLLVGVLVYWAFRAFPRRHPVRRGAVLSAVFLLTEALLGASLVLLHHVANNASVSRVYSLSLHLTNTLTLLACLTLTAWWAGGHPPVRLRGRALATSAATLLTVVAVGITGVIAALGDTLFPAPSLAAGLARDFDPASNAILRLRGLHPALAALAGACVAMYAVARAVGNPRVKKLGYGVVLAVAAQFGAGVLNLALLAPVWMQMIHLLLADLLWIALVLLCASPESG
ncbi:MAG TPA: COX15/CtaA family protein [Bryobacteraceae bacterium]|nr:COX15/CtaA family protein [Bryobacteraceae bacterium]